VHARERNARTARTHLFRSGGTTTAASVVIIVVASFEQSKSDCILVFVIVTLK